MVELELRADDLHRGGRAPGASGEKFEFPVEWGVDLQAEHERYLTEKHVGRPVFVTDYPKEIKAFYMRLNDDEKTVAAMDVLAPGIGEIIGGSQREERLDVLERTIVEAGLDPEDPTGGTSTPAASAPGWLGRLGRSRSGARIVPVGRGGENRPRGGRAGRVGGGGGSGG